MCCENNSDEQQSLSERDLEISNMEKTIEELSEDRKAKDRHIMKMKNELDSFMQEALKSEDEANELIKNQEQIINETKQHISELKQTIEIMQNKSTRSISTQTSILKKVYKLK
ncbi:hypothetical protein JTB14_009786 [Gonioctena quinquepunctata]|nr:hypothetical protein JTB14_009786 [Gonioctena quinquepunctata]